MRKIFETNWDRLGTMVWGFLHLHPALILSVKMYNINIFCMFVKDLILLYNKILITKKKYFVVFVDDKLHLSIILSCEQGVNAFRRNAFQRQ